jgi:enoyl-CoA hydratase
MNADWVRSDYTDGVLTVTIDRAGKHNALSQSILAGIASVLADHAADENLLLAVVRGAGDSYFAAGGDLMELGEVRSRQDIVAMCRHAKGALDQVRNFPLPVIAALNGDALGGGSELAVACDFRVAATHAHLGFIQGRLNAAPAWGGGVDLMRLVGPNRALGLFAGAGLVGGEEALSLGLFDALAVEGENLDDVLDRFTAPMRRQKPQVLRALRALAKGVRSGLPVDELAALEESVFVETWLHDDHWAAVEEVIKRLK